MTKLPKPFLIGKYYYFVVTLRDGRRRNKTTHCTNQGKAAKFIADYFRFFGRGAEMPFRAYQAPFFDELTCPHVARLREEGKSIGRRHVENARRTLDRWVLTDKIFPRLIMSEITRGDLFDLRRRLRERVKAEGKGIKGDGLNTVNKAMNYVKTIFSEAYIREDVARNPGDKIGRIAYEEDTPDELSLEEIRLLFAERPGVWRVANDGKDNGPGELAYDVFRVAALTGMRSGEVLGLGAGQLSGDRLKIDSAWKHPHDTETGPPKWGKTREIIVAPAVREILEARAGSGLIFAHLDGMRLGQTWWNKRFRSAVKAAEIAEDGRRLVPHSLRHSLNTHLTAAGVNTGLIELYLWGVRKDMSAMQKIYGHLGAEITRPVAVKIAELYGGK